MVSYKCGNFFANFFDLMLQNPFTEISFHSQRLSSLPSSIVRVNSFFNFYFYEKKFNKWLAFLNAVKNFKN